MELRHLRYFVTVAEELHFGRAAERLHIAQPPLSQQIRQLEEELGVSLFTRTKRRVMLTEAGAAFRKEALKALAQVEHAAEVARRTARGEVGQLNIGFVGTASYTLPRLFKRFREQYPDVALTLRELTTSQQVQALCEQQLHLGVLRPPVQEPSLQVEIFHREALIVALPEGHRLAPRAALALSELADEPFVLFPRQQGPGLYDTIINLCQQAGFHPRVAQEAIRMETHVGLVAAGFGVSLVPASLQQLQQDGVLYKELQEPSPTIALAFAWRRDEAAPALHAFLRLARSCFS
ncbi:LysR family transcriptional regulator [Thermosporothrix hazakensis]|jgi:DNA-binding transcriptional LysR family regulator|uniref:LysR family transcriptional regulator n=1 Tax=Thermosporothrix hazakensis TaxID=644383 RepID=A0A326UNA0_THEHA|nr:LysR family transcriptional regulator [Thermosporothrix hazakensis]PZW31255.1 LysR family transcriptional regulator [Thermosporothrix hazakensis]GCE50832.1 LysR family transcriptional regulator [Thermosporothrix hazakensis]